MKAIAPLVNHVRRRVRRMSLWAESKKDIAALHHDLIALRTAWEQTEQARKVAEQALITVRDELEVAVTAVWHDKEQNACGVGGWAVHAHAIERALTVTRSIVGRD